MGLKKEGKMADVTVAITVPSEHVSRAVDAMCGKMDRDYKIGRLEEETRPQFAARAIKSDFIEHLKRRIQRFEDTKPDQIVIN